MYFFFIIAWPAEVLSAYQQWFHFLIYLALFDGLRVMYIAVAWF